MATRSNPKRYDLLFGDVKLGEITQRDADFPNCSGAWSAYHSADGAEIRSFIRAYINYSEHADSLMTPDITPEWEAYTREKESEFLDLIESLDWALRDDEGVRHPILIPRFCVRGEIIWCWTFSSAA